MRLGSLLVALPTRVDLPVTVMIHIFNLHSLLFPFLITLKSRNKKEEIKAKIVSECIAGMMIR